MSAVTTVIKLSSVFRRWGGFTLESKTKVCWKTGALSQARAEEEPNREYYERGYPWHGQAWWTQHYPKHSSAVILSQRVNVFNSLSQTEPECTSSGSQGYGNFSSRYIHLWQVMPEPESLCPAQISFNLRRSVEASQTSLMLQRLRSRVLYCTNQRQRLSLSQKEKNYQIKMKMMMRVKGWVCFRFELTELTWGKFHIFFLDHWPLAGRPDPVTRKQRRTSHA